MDYFIKNYGFIHTYVDIGKDIVCDNSGVQCSPNARPFITSDGSILKDPHCVMTG